MNIKVRCKICGKEVDSKGYGGHMFIMHQKKVGVRGDIEEIKKTIEELIEIVSPLFVAVVEGDTYEQFKELFKEKLGKVKKIEKKIFAKAGSGK